jgi:hypothetical protein
MPSTAHAQDKYGRLGGPPRIVAPERIAKMLLGVIHQLSGKFERNLHQRRNGPRELAQLRRRNAKLFGGRGHVALRLDQRAADDVEVEMTKTLGKPVFPARNQTRRQSSVSRAFAKPRKRPFRRVSIDALRANSSSWRRSDMRPGRG